MRLIKSSDTRARHAEPSYSAEAMVRKALESHRSILAGLDELLRDDYRIYSNRDMLDAADLRAAVETNLDAVKPCLLEAGFADEQIETARTDLHNLHQEQGWSFKYNAELDVDGVVFRLNEKSHT